MGCEEMEVEREGMCPYARVRSQPLIEWRPNPSHRPLPSLSPSFPSLVTRRQPATTTATVAG